MRENDTRPLTMRDEKRGADDEREIHRRRSVIRADVRADQFMNRPLSERLSSLDSVFD